MPHLPEGGMFNSLRVRDFRFLWMSSLCTNFAMQMQIVARGWLIYDMTSSPLALTWVMLSFMLPNFLFSLPGGVIADRLKKKSVMLVAQMLNTLATLALAFIVINDQITFLHFIYFGVFNGTVLALSMPARIAMTPEVVTQERFVNAMALQSSTFNLSRVLGPAIAGGLMALLSSAGSSSTFGVGIVFLIIAALYFLSVLVTARIHKAGLPLENGHGSPIEDIKESFAYLGKERIVLGLLIIGFIPSTFGFTASFLLPAFNQDILAGGPDLLGMLMASMGAGALLGSLILARMGDFEGKGRVMFVSAYLWAIALAGFALSDSIMMALITGAISGLFGSVFGALNMSVLQLVVKPEVRGRIMSVMMMTFGLMPLGVIPLSALAEKTGIDLALLLSTVLLVLSTLLIGLFFPNLVRINRGHRQNL
ncbi:MAG: MFS transporter [Pseudomonadales bacterium]|nr:MFS transporter [Pseudomonadales bacterium]